MHSQHCGFVLDTVHALELLSITQLFDITAHVCAVRSDIINKNIRCQSSPGLSVQMILLYGLCSESGLAQAVYTGSLSKCSCCWGAKSKDKKRKLSLEIKNKTKLCRANITKLQAKR